MIASSAIARTALGILEGQPSQDGAVHVFKGIPYAQPPIGALRWRAPEPMTAWPGVRQARAFGLRAVQPERPVDSLGYFGAAEQGEDCLHLNVWSAAQGTRTSSRPVFVWFHGGAFSLGSGSLPIFDGTALARRGIVVVTVNFRLGPLGFMALPELSRESVHGVSGNYGMLDQIAALRWVHEHIAAFGGDPDSVTIGGQSSGSSSVNILMASPLARGLFKHAIGQSGGSMSPPGQPGHGSLLPLAQAEAAGLSARHHLGAATLAELRAMSAEDIVRRWPMDAMSRPWANIDGWLLPRAPFDIFMEGRQADVPLLTGSNLDEGSTQPPLRTWGALHDALTRDLGAADAQTLLAAHGLDGDPADASRAIMGRKVFNWQNWAWARLHARTSRRHVFAYAFCVAPPVPAGRTFDGSAADKLGAFHTAEIPYAFGTLEARSWAWRDVDRRLSETMMSYWVRFITHGDPNGPDLPPWTALSADAHASPEAGAVLHLGPDMAMGPVPFPEEMALWDVGMARLRSRT